MRTSFLIILLISSISVAKSAGPLEICTEFMDKNGERHQLSQIWFASGDDPNEIKFISNYTLDYSEKPFAHQFTFDNIPKKKLWLECVYFPCEDAACESIGSSSETVLHEMKQIPVSCKSKVKTDSTRMESFSCKYRSDSKEKSSKQ